MSVVKDAVQKALAAVETAGDYGPTVTRAYDDVVKFLEGETLSAEMMAEAVYRRAVVLLTETETGVSHLKLWQAIQAKFFGSVVTAPAPTPTSH